MRSKFDAQKIESGIAENAVIFRVFAISNSSVPSAHGTISVNYLSHIFIPPTKISFAKKTIEANVIIGINELLLDGEIDADLKDSEVFVNKLSCAQGATLKYNNTYNNVADNDLVKVSVGENSSISLTGIHMNLGNVSLKESGTLDFVYNPLRMNPINLKFTPAADKEFDMPQMEKLCVFLKGQKFTESGFHLPLEFTGALKLYHSLKEIVKPMLDYHGGSANAVDNYISRNFLELTGACHSPSEESELSKFNSDIMGEIGSYIDISEF